MSSFNSFLQKFIFTSSIVFIAFFVGFYVFQIQGLTQHYYQAKIYQKEIKTLTNSIQNLDNQYQSLASLGQLLPKIQELGLIKVESLGYLDLGTNQMAAR